VGNGGTILRTTDGGANWVTQTSGTLNHLYGVSFTDASHGTAVGVNGTILRTNTGGSESGQVTQNYSVQNKWNIVSIPLTVDDYSRSSVFPTAISNAFYFDALYQARDTLENGKAYWVKFGSAQEISMTGFPRAVDTIDVKAGWNIIGSVSSPVPVSTIGSIPGGIVTSSFFGFTDMYEASTTIEPGKGYWVKVTEAGQLILDATGMMPALLRIRIRETAELPPAPNPGN
jgi:hypothetical protein